MPRWHSGQKRGANPARLLHPSVQQITCKEAQALPQFASSCAPRTPPQLYALDTAEKLQHSTAALELAQNPQNGSGWPWELQNPFERLCDSSQISLLLQLPPLSTLIASRGVKASSLEGFGRSALPCPFSLSLHSSIMLRQQIPICLQKKCLRHRVLALRYPKKELLLEPGWSTQSPHGLT